MLASGFRPPSAKSINQKNQSRTLVRRSVRWDEERCSSAGDPDAARGAPTGKAPTSRRRLPPRLHEAPAQAPDADADDQDDNDNDEDEDDRTTDDDDDDDGDVHKHWRSLGAGGAS